MQPDKRDAAYLWDVFRAARLSQVFIHGMNGDAFCRDEKTYFACVAQLQIIGEATKRLSEAFRNNHPDVPWADMARMRDWLIHHYDRIRIDVVWDTLIRDIPTLISRMQPLLPEEPDEQ